MHDTIHGTPDSAIPSAPSAMPEGDLATYLDNLARTRPEIVVKLIGLIDEFERLFRDEPTAWAAIEAEIGARRARREARKATGRPDDIPMAAGSPPREPRPDVGFDREIATYKRLKPALLEGGEGKWIVIVGEDAIGPFDEISDAERAGLRRFGEGPMFIKQVLIEEPPPLVLPPYLDISCQTGPSPSHQIDPR